MATVRELITALAALTQSESDETQSDILASLTEGSDTAISVLLAIRDALATPDTGASDLLLAFNAFRTDMAGYHSDLLTAIDTAAQLINSGVALVRTDTQAMAAYLTNNLAQSQALIYNQLLAIGRNQLALACLCADGAPALPPPLDLNGPTDVAEHCRRVQFFVDKMTDAVCAAEGAIADGLTITSDVAATFFGAGVIPGVTLAVLPSAIVTGAIIVLGRLAAEQILEPCEWLQTNSEALINALYNATSASEAQSAWYSLVDSTTNPVTELDLRLILKAPAWAGALNALYDQSNEWDTSAYNANNCGDFTGCYNSEGEAVVVTNWSYITKSSAWPDPNIEWLTEINSTGGLVTFNKPFLAWGDFSNYTFRVVSGTVQLYYRTGGPEASQNMGIINYTPADGTWGAPGTQLLINIHGGNNGTDDYVLEVCPNALA